VFERSGLCSWGCLQKETVKRGRGKTVRRRVSVFGVSVSVSKREKRGRRVEEASMEFDMHVCKNDAVLGTTFPPKAQHDAVLGTTFPPKAQHDAVLGTTFLPKAQHDAVLGTKFPTKFPTLDRPILSFFFGFLFVNNLNINKWVGSFKTNSPFAYFNFIKKMGLVGQLVSGFQWANGFGLFLQPLTLMYKILSN
jgi:hypothetical protein